MKKIRATDVRRKLSGKEVTRGVEAVFKARVVRHPFKGTNLSAHLAWDGDHARMFDADRDDARPAGVRRAIRRRPASFSLHRFATQDDADMTDLRAFTRDLVNCRWLA